MRDECESLTPEVICCKWTRAARSFNLWHEVQGVLHRCGACAEPADVNLKTAKWRHLHGRWEGGGGGGYKEPEETVFTSVSGTVMAASQSDVTQSAHCVGPDATTKYLLAPINT